MLATLSNSIFIAINFSLSSTRSLHSAFACDCEMCVCVCISKVNTQFFFSFAFTFILLKCCFLAGITYYLSKDVCFLSFSLKLVFFSRPIEIHFIFILFMRNKLVWLAGLGSGRFNSQNFRASVSAAAAAAPATVCAVASVSYCNLSQQVNQRGIKLDPHNGCHCDAASIHLKSLILNEQAVSRPTVFSLSLWSCHVFFFVQSNPLFIRTQQYGKMSKKLLEQTMKK